MSTKSKKKLTKKVAKEKQKLDDEKLFEDLEKIRATDKCTEISTDDANNNTNKNTDKEPVVLPATSDNSKISISATDSKTADELIAMAGEMYKTLKEHVKEHPEFMELEDKKKLDYFLDKYGYTDFRKEFPIVVRYMICMGQYSSKAFRRFLNKVQSVVHPPPDKREKGYMEDQWVRRQADYVRYLWEAYQKGHYNTAEAAWVWEDSYKKLKGEFDDFRDTYKSIEAKTKEEKEALKAQNAKDLLERLKTGQQTLNDDDAEKLLFALKDKVYKRRFLNTMKELLDKHKPVPASYEGTGCGEEEVHEDPNKPKIVMVETVDESRIDEIPENLRLTEEEAKKLPGFNNNLPTVIEE